MIGKLNHVAIAVPDLAAATALYRDTLGANVSDPEALPEHGVTVVFVDTGETRIELLEPLGEDSLIARLSSAIDLSSVLASAAPCCIWVLTDSRCWISS